MEMIDCVIWSKDRACQLDLLFRSIKDNFSFLKNIHILYTFSSEFFEKGYKKLMIKFPNIIFHKETSFKQNNIDIFNSFTSEFCMGFVDDNVVYNKIDLNMFSKGLQRLRHNPKIHVLNLRLRKDMTYNHPQDCYYPLPKFIEEEYYLLWDWSIMNPMNEWGYPCCVDSYVYRTDYYKYCANNLQYNEPNSFEGQINSHRVYKESLMLGLLESKILLIPNNLTQKGFTRHSLNLEYSLENLNKKYLDGFVIDTNNIYGVKNNAPHFEIPFKFIRE